MTTSASTASPDVPSAGGGDSVFTFAGGAPVVRRRLQDSSTVAGPDTSSGGDGRGAVAAGSAVQLYADEAIQVRAFGNLPPSGSCMHA